MRIFLVALLSAISFIYAVQAKAQSPGSLQWVIIEFEDLRGVPAPSQSGQLISSFGSRSLAYSLHDGSFRPFSEGELASDAFGSFATRGDIGDLRSELQSLNPDAVIDRIQQGGLGLFSGKNSVWISVRPAFDVTKHRFLTYFARLCPSNDAFVSNEIPIEIFDEDGAFTGPLIINIYGRDVMDAGVRQNNEINLHCLDNDAIADSEPGVPTQEPIRRHPGYNGSLGNPSGSPVRILGASGTYFDENNRSVAYSFEPEYSDFTRPDFPIARLRVTSGAHGGFNGTYFDPQRDGEGVTLEVSGRWSNRQVTLAWYTYRPDGSGDPVYLYGVAPISRSGESATIDLYQTSGGVFASLMNPQLVESQFWGRADVIMQSCSRIKLQNIVPLDAAWDAPEILNLDRLSPPPTGFEEYCGGPVYGIAPQF